MPPLVSIRQHPIQQIDVGDLPEVRSYHDISGHRDGNCMTMPWDRVALVRLTYGAKRVVEFGINLGWTAQLLLTNCPSIEDYLGIDVPPGYVPPIQAQHIEVTPEVGKWAKHDSRLRLLIRPTQDVDPADIGRRDVAFIDADHSFAGVMRDTALARACVRPGGMIIWHDYRMPGQEPTEVNHVLDQMAYRGRPIVHVRNSWIAFEYIL